METPTTSLPCVQQFAPSNLLRVGEVAVVFREHVATGELARVWSLIDPELRMAWVHDWTENHCARLRHLCPKRLADRLSSLDGPGHPLWKHFAAEQILLLQAETARTRCPNAGLPPLAPDTEVLYARSDHPDEWGAPDDPHTMPVVLRWNGAAWKILAYGTTDPTPARAPSTRGTN